MLLIRMVLLTINELIANFPRVVCPAEGDVFVFPVLVTGPSQTSDKSGGCGYYAPQPDSCLSILRA